MFFAHLLRKYLHSSNDNTITTTTKCFTYEDFSLNWLTKPIKTEKGFYQQLQLN